MSRPHRFDTGRHAGLLVPLFSMPSSASWGVGEIADLPHAARWLRRAGLDFLQLLPVNEMASGQNSPYSALSASAIDPIYIALRDVDEYQQLGGDAALDAESAAALARIREAGQVDYPSVRELKTRWLERCFALFEESHASVRSRRGRDFEAFVERERSWLEPYAAFRALHLHHRELPWWEWESIYCTPAELPEIKRRFERPIRYTSYLQWIAHTQWRKARRACGEVGLFGDLPFMVGGDSADVWMHQHAFMFDATLGVPPDAFSETGQDWGVPVYRWEAFASDDFAWFKERAARSAALFDGYRIDHLVGFYRTYVRPADSRERYFTPATQPEQIQLGERMLSLFKASGATIVAEDLGTVPDFVRESMARLDVPGFKVMRWERAWSTAGAPFIDPARYPERSVATSGTHDTETLATWWTEADRDERQAFARLLGVHGHPFESDAPFTAGLRDAVLDLLMSAASAIVIFPVQDVFGWPERINTPATVGERNWTYRLPWLIDEWLTHPAALERARHLRALAARYGRLAP